MKNFKKISLTVTHHKYFSIVQLVISMNSSQSNRHLNAFYSYRCHKFSNSKAQIPSYGKRNHLCGEINRKQ